MAALAKISFRMDERSPLCRCFLAVSDRFKHFILDFYLIFGCCQDRFIFSDHQTDRVADAPCDISYGDHNIPVLLDVTDLVIGNILGRQNTGHTFHGKRFRRVNTKDTRSRIFRADCRSMNHAIHLYIIRVFTVSENFRSYIDAEASTANAGVTARLCFRINLLIASKDCCGEHNPLDDFLVACASAYVAPYRSLDLILGRV